MHTRATPPRKHPGQAKYKRQLENKARLAAAEARGKLAEEDESALAWYTKDSEAAIKARPRRPLPDAADTRRTQGAPPSARARTRRRCVGAFFR